MKVKEIMKGDVLMAAPTDLAEDAWKRMLLEEIHHLVVMDSGKVVGVVSAHDLGGFAHASVRRGRTVGELMSRQVVHTNPRAMVSEAALAMLQHEVGCLPVLADGKVVGILSVKDLLSLIAREEVAPVLPDY